MGFLHGSLCPIDQEYVILNNRTTDLVSFATPHLMFPPLPCLESLKASQEECVHCSTRAHTSYECDAYRQVVKQALRIKSKNPPSVGDDAVESRPGAGPRILTKRVPEKDSWYRYRKVQNNIPRPGFTSRITCFGQLNVVPIPKED